MASHKMKLGVSIAFWIILLIFHTAPAKVLLAQEDHALGFFPLRSQSPIQQLRFGIQHHPPWTVPKGTWALQLQHTWKNMWLYQDGLFRIDGEIHETVARGAYGVTERLELMIELPARYLSGGILDGLIEGFHSTLGLGQAARDQFPRNQFVVEVCTPQEGDSKFRISSSDVGWQMGNIVLSSTYSLVEKRDQNFKAVITGNVKLPTGSTTDLFGSQKIDYGLSFGVGYKIQPFHIYYNTGLLYFGDKTVLGLELRQWRLSSLFAIEYHKASSNHSWILQGLVESGVAKDYSQFSKRTSELMFGYKHRYQSGWVLEVGFLENLFYFDNSPDIALHAAVTKFL